ncbi:predicted protein [Histoplasma capsulatum G186AR]|uniref:Uncharacterized protein n=1 Tax=Ajellomyces capsulatus (strain G186AR / H82 / ATCC MYA-2454 / RMSCC 2432) TaxID=447093 RepID=C0NFN8_AJECG|nr:uncharacterized protein HCBG_01704 [Histoplasma capsulatum G186AR]EEH10059.1 predicted protein [Histoplasma capsulatum G186AR]
MSQSKRRMMLADPDPSVLRVQPFKLPTYTLVWAVIKSLDPVGLVAEHRAETPNSNPSLLRFWFRASLGIPPVKRRLLESQSPKNPTSFAEQTANTLPNFLPPAIPGLAPPPSHLSDLMTTAWLAISLNTVKRLTIEPIFPYPLD